MKKTIFTLLVFLSVSVIGRQIQSNGTGGGIFSSAASWQGGTIPNIIGDTVEILGTDAISVASPSWPAWGKTQIDAGGSLTVNSNISMWGVINNNGSIKGSGLLYIIKGPTRHGTILIESTGGTGTWSSITGRVYFACDNVNIASGCTIDLSSANFYLDSYDNANSTVTVDNLGTFKTSTITNASGGVVACTWTNDVNSFLTFGGGSFTGGDTFNASANGNTVTFSGGNLNTPTGNTYYNLIIGSSTVIEANLSLNNLTVNANCNFNSFGMTLTGNFINNSSTPNKGLITFDGASLQTIGGTGSTGFPSGITLSSGADVQLAIGATVSGGNLTLNTNSTFNCQNFQLTGNTTGNLTLASGASLILGLPTSATVVTFPTNFTTANITLNAASTVTYEANAAQAVSSTPSSYGNLVISTGAAASTKSVSSTLKITGNLTVNSLATLSAVANTVTLTGNFTNSGTLSFNTGPFNIGGNFTNNGTYTAGTNTTTTTGSSGQTIGGTSATTFYSLTANGTGAETVTLGNNITVSNNFQISAGTFDASASNYNFTVGSNFTNNGTFTARNGTVTITGTGIVGGTSSTLFYNFTKSTGGTVTLGNNETATNSFLVSAGTFDVSASNYSLSVGGNFTNNSGAAAFVARAGTVTLSGSSGQTVGGTASTSFYNLTATGNGAETVTLGIAETATGNFLISAGTFDVSASNYNLTVGGNLTSNGTINTRTGLITLNGSGQTVNGTTVIPFYDLTVNETSSAQTVTLAASESFSDVLTMTKGILASSGAGTMVLISNAAATGRIAQITAGNASITAAFVAQRYETSRGTTANYASLSTPFTNVETVGDWNSSNQTLPNKFYMSISGGSNGLSYYSNGQPYYSVYAINEASPSTNYAEYVPVTTASTVISNGEGLYIWLGTSLSAMSNPYTYIQHGTPSVGTVPVIVTRTVAGQNGFNLIGNPYASPISWAQFQTDNAGLSLQNQYYVMGTSGSWENSITNGLPDAIPMCQGFGVLVQAAAGSYTANFQEDQKTSGNPLLNRPIENINYANIVLSDDSNANSCRTTLAFGSKYVKTYDAGIDAYFIQSKGLGVPALYTLTENNEQMMYKALPDNEQTIDVPLTVIAQVKANYTLTVNSEALASYQCINLVDKTTGQVINNFNTNPGYTFYLPKAGTERDFVLRFTKLTGEQTCNSSSIASTETASDNITIASVFDGAAVNFNLQQECTATISVYNVLGQKIMSDITTNAFNNRVLLNLTEGQLYVIKVQTPDGIIVKKLYR